MPKIVDWEYYSSLHDVVNKEDFQKAESMAEKEVRRVVGAIRWAGITEETFGFEQLQDCICNVMDLMAEQEESGCGKGIASVSNDGYAESYAVQTEEQARMELQSAILSWLSGTGLAGAY